MKQSERTLGFFATLLIAFGISDLNLEYLDFKYNEMAYIAIGLGAVMAVIFVINRIKNKRA